MNPFERVREFKRWSLDMTYITLKAYFTYFHTGKITKNELICAIGLWQETLYGGIK